ncbi:flagellar hook-associated protein 2 [Amphibacillus indicireducens]|uniref:Flagellar hook-associated protein 2 n=1 Tax=Amphibacillus indicireducens TaxID=1076330 RepID=A0ABP7VEH5_9BACI
MGMRIGGLATGMDIDGIVKDLMAAERIPLDKLEQDKTRIEWQRDAFRDVNSMLLELDKMMLDMKMTRTYNTKAATSSNQAVTATAASGASIGSYNIAVKSLATSAINATNGTLSKVGEKIDPFAPLSEQISKLAKSGDEGVNIEIPTQISFRTYQNSSEGTLHTIDVTADDTLNSILTKITNHKEAGVRAFYDVQSDRVIMERTSAGDFNPNGAEIDFSEDSGFFTNVFGMTAQEQGGTDAKFAYNGIELTSKTNSTTLNGITFTFNDVTASTNVNITNDTETAFNNIKAFVDKYNDMIDKVNGKLTEAQHRDFPPLTTEQMKDMSDREIELWEEKARSGLLRRDPILTNALSQMRQAWSGRVSNDGPFSHFSQIGISTTANYMDGGKLEINENKLRAALQEDSDAVYKLFSNNAEGAERGIVNRLEDAIDRTTERINQQAGRTTQQPHQYALGRRLEGMDDRIEVFKRRLQQVEDRYWKQFSAMELAIQRMNEQSNFLFSQFNQQW